mmetsp:Transcript_20647/g.79227  ORF Transcript_20647/g.79227 Transcript_20647/m.79227 type:complete len:206 (-) Transcript_20647:273-890(-)
MNDSAHCPKGCRAHNPVAHVLIPPSSSRQPEVTRGLQDGTPSRRTQRLDVEAVQRSCLRILPWARSPRPFDHTSSGGECGRSVWRRGPRPGKLSEERSPCLPELCGNGRPGNHDDPFEPLDGRQCLQPVLPQLLLRGWPFRCQLRGRNHRRVRVQAGRGGAARPQIHWKLIGHGQDRSDCGGGVALGSDSFGQTGGAELVALRPT